jgi:hypothetical protein
MFLFFAAALLLTALLFERVLKKGADGEEARKVTGYGLLAGGALALFLTLVVQGGGAPTINSLFGPTTHFDALQANLGTMIIGGWIAALSCFGLWGALRSFGKGALPAAGLLSVFLGLTAVDLLVADAPFVNALPYANFFPARPDYDQLKGLLGPGERVLPSDHVMRQGELATYGVPEVFGYHGNEPRWYDVATIRNFRDNAYMSDPQQYNAYLLQLMTSGMGRALAAKIAILPATDIPITGWERLGGDAERSVYRSLNSLPGGALVPEVIVEPDTMKILQGLWNPILDVAKTALVTEPIPAVGNGGGKGSFQITSEASDTVVVQVTSNAPALVLLSRTWHPYWQVDVDGVRQEIVRTDYTLMGVPVTAGTHTLIFRYRSPIIAKAELISGSSWALVLLVTLWTLVDVVRKRRSAGV